MTCKGCGTELICHMSNYKGDFKNKLQWQNEDGKAHYATTNGKDFTCNIPEEETNPNKIELKDNKKQTILQESTTAATLTAGDAPRLLNNLINDEMITRIYSMLEVLIQDFTDRKLKESKT